MTSNTNGGNSSFTPHLVIGLGLIFLGLVLVLDRLGIVPASKGLEYWPVGLILLGAALVLQAFRGRPAVEPSSGNQMPGSQGSGNHTSVAPAIVLLIFVLVFVRPFRHDPAARDAGGRQQVVAVLTSDERRSVGEVVRNANVMSLMGGAVLDLRKAVIPEGQPLVIDVFTLMGGTVLRMPPEWTLELKITAVMGGVNDERRRLPEQSSPDGMVPDGRPEPPHVILRGFVMMGGVAIKS